MSIQDARQQHVPLFEQIEAETLHTPQDASAYPFQVDVAARFISLRGLEEIDDGTQLPDDVGSSLSEYEAAEEAPALKVGILKAVAQYDGWREIGGSFDGYEFKAEPQDLSRAIKSFTGKKDKRAQSLLEDAIGFISKNPKGEGSLTLRGLDKGQGTPFYNNERVKLWRFKPSDVATLPNSEALRKVRIVYTVVELEDGQEVLGIVDIINRGDFEKKYN